MTYPDYLKKIEPNDYITENTFWHLISIFGTKFITSIIEKHNGIVNNRCIEEIAENSNLIWNLKRVKRGYILVCGVYQSMDEKHKTIEQYTSLECMRKYKLEWMEDAMERTYYFIGLEFERDYKLKQLLNESNL